MLRRLFVALSLAVVAQAAAALDYRSVSVPAAVLFDAPSQAAKKLYLIKAMTPVEVVVKIEGWSKVRDAEGTLAWIETRNLSDQRTLAVIAPRAEIRSADRPDAPVVAELEKWVGVEYLEPASPGWVKVRHRDGVTGYLRAMQVWGL
jgi:SH3-like domain-containing protein